jgi:sugar lactone lactonase YvrE
MQVSELKWTVKLLGTISAVLMSSVLHAQTIATTAGGFVGDGRLATQAGIQEPYGVAQDSAGNIYVSDFSGNRVRQIAVNGKISTFAGTGISGYTGDGALAAAATLSFPNGIVVDSSGNVLIADGGNGVIRKVNTSGIITTIAGTGVFGDTGDGGQATLAEIGQAYGMALDKTGNLYFTDVFACVVRKIDTTGIITTVAGDYAAGCGYNGDGIPATTAMLNFPRGVVTDSSGNVYISDTQNHRVRLVNLSGNISTFAGTGNSGFSGDGGLATLADVGNPRGLAFRQGTLYIANAGDDRIRSVVVKTNIITTYVGSQYGYDGDNHPLLSTETSGVGALTFNAGGHLLFVDPFNSRLREVADTVVKTIGGGFSGDGNSATSATLVLPEAIAFDQSGNYYIADAGGNRIRKVNTAGKISTVAGTGVSGYTGDNGLATSATLYFPSGVAADASGNIFVADTFNHVIRKIGATGTISTFATNANFTSLSNMAVDTSGNLYVADFGTCVIWKITPSGTTTVAAGTTFVCGYAGDGGPAVNAQLNDPYGVAVDSKGNIYIGDYSNNRVRKVSSAGKIGTITGDGNCGFTGDGSLATSAEVCLPAGVAVDSLGNVYFADEGNLRIREITKGMIKTIGGSGQAGYNGDGLSAMSTNLDDPIAVAVDSHNTVYFADDEVTRIRRIH